MGRLGVLGVRVALLPLLAVWLDPVETADSGRDGRVRYIVQFDPARVTAAGVESSLGRAPAGTVVRRRFARLLSGFSAELDEAGRAYYESLGARVGPVFRVQAAAVPSWGLDRVDQRSLPLDGAPYAPALRGDGVSIFVLDTGVNLAHLEFSGRIADGYDFVSDDTVPNDCNGHGTHAAATALGATFGVAPGARLHALRVLDCAGNGASDDVLAALEYVANHKATLKVASLSLGGAGRDRLLEEAVERVVALGTTVVVASGNEGRDACAYTPAATPSAITVGATTSTDFGADFSNAGACVDILAPGAAIRSAWIGGSSRSATLSGTSSARARARRGAARSVARHVTWHRARSARALTHALLLLAARMRARARARPRPRRCRCSGDAARLGDGGPTAAEAGGGRDARGRVGCDPRACARGRAHGLGGEPGPHSTQPPPCPRHRARPGRPAAASARGRSRRSARAHGAHPAGPLSGGCDLGSVPRGRERAWLDARARR